MLKNKCSTVNYWFVADHMHPELCTLHILYILHIANRMLHIAVHAKLSFRDLSPNKYLKLHNSESLCTGVCCTESEREHDRYYQSCHKNSTFSKETNIKRLQRNFHEGQNRRTNTQTGDSLVFQPCEKDFSLVQMFSFKCIIWFHNPLTEKFCVLISCSSFIHQSWSWCSIIFNPVN